MVQNSKVRKMGVVVKWDVSLVNDSCKMHMAVSGIKIVINGGGIMESGSYKIR